ncbi:hypothetical protein SDC9_154390 [bioreactor metagenome]|uniref:Uncharacterized protein n=1 Tax=bioreactor metagenome TaxID=1076179 RepID=A0A645F3E2_9ZZZZ
MPAQSQFKPISGQIGAVFSFVWGYTAYVLHTTAIFAQAAISTLTAHGRPMAHRLFLN